MPSSLPISDTRLLFITDRNRSKGRSNVEVVRAAIKGGCKWIQYREPELSDREFYNECLKIRELTRELKVGLIVNGRLDVAALVRADGVHVGASGLPVRVVKEFAGDDFIVGYSAHTIEEAVTAVWEGADYLTYSPFFPLEHKSSPFKPHGIEGAREVIRKVNVPVFFLGGIRSNDLKDLVKAITPMRIASVSMISEAENITHTVEESLEILGKT
jgi:thiamine-phosphate pyrophosphorylase